MLYSKEFVRSLPALKKRSSNVVYLCRKRDANIRADKRRIEELFAFIPEESQDHIRNRLQSQDNSQFWSGVQEAYSYWTLLSAGLSPQYSPDVNGKTPDNSFLWDNAPIYVEVASLYQKSDFDQNHDGSADKDLDRIRREVKDKNHKYKCLNAPLILFLFARLGLGVDRDMVIDALYGQRTFRLCISHPERSTSSRKMNAAFTKLKESKSNARMNSSIDAVVFFEKAPNAYSKLSFTPIVFPNPFAKNELPFQEIFPSFAHFVEVRRSEDGIDFELVNSEIT